MYSTEAAIYKTLESYREISVIWENSQLAPKVYQWLPQLHQYTFHSEKKTHSHHKFKCPWSVHLYSVPREVNFFKHFLLNHFYSTVKSKNFVREDTGWKITLNSMANDKFEEKIFNSGMQFTLNMTQGVPPIRTWSPSPNFSASVSYLSSCSLRFLHRRRKHFFSK